MDKVVGREDALMRIVIVTAIALAGLAACSSMPSNRSLVLRSAPPVSEFSFDAGHPLSDADDFAPWSVLAAANEEERPALEDCIANRDACATGHLLRYRRLLEVASSIPPEDQLALVHEYFNSIDQTLDSGAGHAGEWPSILRVASTHRGDCKAIALSKYFTLRRLGWPVENLRVVMEWDDRESDWHALLAVRDARETYILDSILGPQQPEAFSFGYMVYSISEMGIWDHAPGFVPVP